MALSEGRTQDALAVLGYLRQGADQAARGGRPGRSTRRRLRVRGLGALREDVEDFARRRPGMLLLLP